MATLQQQVERLEESWRRVNQTWQEVRESWRDEAAENFEKQFWQPFVVDVDKLYDVLKELSKTVSAIERHLR